MAEQITMRSALEQMVATFAADQGGAIEHALVTTFNFDPGFFERNVLPLICGLSVTDLKSMSLDATVREMYHPLKRTKVVVAYDQGVLQGVSGGGVRYAILPRHLKEGFFHAKLVVLTGKDASGRPMAAVMVGSGNMTLSGWADNIEVAAWVPVSQNDARELISFYEYLNAPAELSEGMDILGKITGEQPDHELFLQYPSRQGGSLFERIFAPVLSEDMRVYSPYWSEEAVRRFASNGKVVCYPAKGMSGYQFPVASSQLKHENSIIQLMAIKAEERFRHAKAYIWGSYLAIGSANCTLQALHTRNNVEAMLRFRGHVFPAPPSEPLQDWILNAEEEEGIKPAPLEVLVIADYDKRVYQLHLKVSSQSRCESWSLRLGDMARKRQGDHEELIPFEVNKSVARVFRVEWQGSDGPGFLTGMIIPKGGNDVELGYRPKRNLDRIFEDMLRHRPAGGGSGLGATEREVGDLSDVEADDADGDDSRKEDAFEFDMYGMYQSFFHLRKDVSEITSSASYAPKQEEIADTLLEILQAVKDGEVSNDLQRWLIVQECMDLVGKMPNQQKFKPFHSLEKLLSTKLMRLLEGDRELQRYKISPKDLMDWVCKELRYGR